MPQSNLSKALHSRPFQMEGARFVMEKRCVLIADEPGLGKTMQSIAAIVGSKTKGSILVVAPKTAAYVTWPAELRKWLSDISPEDPIRIIGSKMDRPTRIKLMRTIIEWDWSNKDGRQWIIVSPNYIRFKHKVDEKDNYIKGPDGEKIVLAVREALKPLLGIEWSAIIVDEAQDTLSGATGELKTQSAQNTGLQILEVKPGGIRLALSGTPFRGKYENIWGILHWLDKKNYRGYWPWTRKHFDVYHDPVYDQDIIGNLRSEKELYLELQNYMIRRTKAEVVPELPSKIYGGTPHDPLKAPPSELEMEQARCLVLQRKNPKCQITRANADNATHKLATWYDENNPIAVWLDMDPKQKTLYKQMKKEAMVDLDNGVLMANSLLAVMTRLKQFANSVGTLDKDGNLLPALPSNKFDWIIQFLSERGITGPQESGNRIIIASQFTRHINLFEQELNQKFKIPTFKLVGSTSSEDRQNFQEWFQSGKLPNGKPSPEVFLLNTKAGGVSLTLDRADDVVIVDTTYNRDDQIQVEDRAHRISRIHTVNIWNLVTRGTVDEQLLIATRKMGRSIERILDNPHDILELLES